MALSYSAMERNAKRRFKVTPRFSQLPLTNLSNGFVDGVTYAGVGHYLGLVIHVKVDGFKRVVSMDGDGGAHLQHDNELSGRRNNAITAGHFEIEEVE